MNVTKLISKAFRVLAGVAAVLMVGLPALVWADTDQTFDVLQVGTTTYRNVTVTTHNSNYVFLVYPGGMASIKVSDLSNEVRAKLGYKEPEPPKPKPTPALWARQTLSKIDTSEVRQVQTQLSGLLAPGHAMSRLNAIPMTRNFLIAAGGIAAALYLAYCFCCLLICRKSGVEPGLLIWLPVLQMFPLLKAARMSPWWFLGFFVPVLNLAASILWCIRIADARGKTFVVALLLILPVTSPFAFLYLALSAGPSSRKENRRIEIMSLEAA
ncbi:MAG TPA: hypothetical protein VKY92_01280 [Verrucomicrobiae bacterium]|nr:hypothetical protein [Verrucomicrobiae bacterium]